jgi:hypothetical protein
MLRKLQQFLVVFGEGLYLHHQRRLASLGKPLDKSSENACRFVAVRVAAPKPVEEIVHLEG